MKATRTLAPLLATAAVVASCGGGFGKAPSERRLVVSLVEGDRGSPEAPLPLSFRETHAFKVRIEARRPDDTLDTGFNGVVRVSVKPGTVVPVPGASARNVQLANGVADGVPVAVVAAYGETRVWVEDEGDLPVDPLRDPAPQCSNGKDDDGDGDVDFPLDTGCASPVDDTETGGSYAVGVSEPLWFRRPRVADVRGDDSGGAKTPFSSEQVDVDTGFRPERNEFDFDVVVTRISSQGFYVTDLDPKEPRPYRSLYSFTFSAPQRLRVCDRMKTFTGTATEFFGMTQLSSPTWTVELWNPNRRPCLVPEPAALGLDQIGDTPTLFANAAGLVRVRSTATQKLTAARYLGSATPEQAEGEGGAVTYRFSRDATNCDLNKNGRIDFGAGSLEQACSDACKAEPDCSEWTGFRDQRNFMLVLEEPQPNGQPPRRGKIQADASAAPAFDPLGARGAPLAAFTGTLGYFSGGSQFTIEARCDDDITPEGQNPLPNDVACVDPRTDVDNEALQ